MSRNGSLAKLVDQLQSRVAELERQVEALKCQAALAPQKDWRRTIGMFADDEVMTKIFEAGARIRERDRIQGRRGNPKMRRRAKA